MNKIKEKLQHYVSKAIHDFNLIEKGDRVMACLSGGKDSFTLVSILAELRVESNYLFELFVFTLDQAQPGWDDSKLRVWLEAKKLPYEILHRDTYSIVKEKIPEGQTYCSLCSRLRRGNIYRYAEDHGYNKVALGHHRDDLITTLLMSILYNGQIKSMPPKLLSDNQKHIVIRPLPYCQETDIIEYANGLFKLGLAQVIVTSTSFFIPLGNTQDVIGIVGVMLWIVYWVKILRFQNNFIKG